MQVISDFCFPKNLLCSSSEYNDDKIKKKVFAWYFSADLSSKNHIKSAIYKNEKSGYYKALFVKLWVATPNGVA